MDNTNCLKNLTEAIVKKQIDSIESIKNLSQAVDNVNSDISNLISSLLMVGNRQFAENRILDDDSLASGEHIMSEYHHIKNTPPHPQSDYRTPELSLGTILKEALALLPRAEEITINCESEDIANHYEKSLEPAEVLDETLEEKADKFTSQALTLNPSAILRQELEIRYGSLLDKAETPVAESEPLTADSRPDTEESPVVDNETARNHERNDNSEKRDNNTTIQNSNTSVDDRSSQNDGHPIDNQDNGSMVDDEIGKHGSTAAKPVMDRDRVANILKKYSLYDDDEDYEEEEDDSE